MGGTLIVRLARLGIGGLSNCARPHYADPMTANNARLLALLAAIVAAAALRLVPHPPNFSPIDAMALFSAAYLGRRALAFFAPLAALLMSDAVLGFYDAMWVQYLTVALVVLIGWGALRQVSLVRVGGAAVASSVLFFLVTNFGTWALSGMYPQTLAGLAACYFAAIPFFQNTLAGDLFFSGLLFGGFALLERAVATVRLRAPRPA